MREVTNLTVSHLSPLISYVPGMLWSDGGQDPLKADYQGKGYHSTNSSEGQGRLFFTWVGTDIWVYGGYRERLGPYRVSIDGKHHRDFDGFQEGDNQTADAVLFNSTDLKLNNSEHHMEITNVGHGDGRLDGVFDINRIVYEHNANNRTNISASDPHCQWSTSNNSSMVTWIPTEDSMTAYSSSAHMNITFSGEEMIVVRGGHPTQSNFLGTGIFLYGAIAPSSSPFVVAVDGVPQVMHPNPQVNSSATEPQLLFVYEGIQSGPHTLAVWNNPVHSLQAGAPTTLNIHHALVFESSQNHPQSPDSQHNNMVISIVTGTVVIVILALLVLLIWQTRRRHIRKRRKYTPQPFTLKVPSPASAPRSPHILPRRLSAALSRLTSRIQDPLSGYNSLAGDSNIATQATTPSEVQEYYDDFSPTATAVMIPSRRNTAQIMPGPGKSVARSMRATIHIASQESSVAAELPDAPLLPPPIAAVGQGPGHAGTWPSDNQRSITSRAL
ncbi:hypothetical protein BDY19DRAFT_995563 [Irpex rosettiformis]|uniref:Uncharacterized protein n=1 Tax=Irpex rosettiformis TaxID=378272 RepID=A0ACB8TY73_9APHY|nr:hypothetical protein BDY19DRAFT_995563 [Irpex rosettiformis]